MNQKKIVYIVDGNTAMRVALKLSISHVFIIEEYTNYKQ